jgi:hypothetical protein
MCAGHKKRARSLRVLRAAQRFASPRAGRCLDQNRRAGKGAAGLLNNINQPLSFPWRSSLPRTRCAPSPRHKRVYARLRRAMAKRSGERGGVRGTFSARPPHPFLHVASTELPSPRKRGEGAIMASGRALTSHDFKQPSSFPRRVFAPGVCFFASLTPVKGWRSAERRTDACEASVGPALSGQARHLARRLASPYGGRPPPGARTVAILGYGAALPLTGIAAGSGTANSHVRVVVPGGGPLPPRGDGCESPPQDATPRSVLRIVSRARPLMSKAENLCSNVANRSQVLNTRCAGASMSGPTQQARVRPKWWKSQYKFSPQPPGDCMRSELWREQYVDKRSLHAGRAMNVMRAALWPILAAARRAENPLPASFAIIAASA